MSEDTSRKLFMGVDVGTGSVRVALFDEGGEELAQCRLDIEVHHPSALIYEQSSENVWGRICAASNDVLRQANVDKEQVLGIGFAATCSLVILDENLSAVNDRNIIMWCDHRASSQQQRINATKHELLRHAGGEISVEMQPPKILWIKENQPEIYEKCKFFDLADFLTMKASGEECRSTCTTACKWLRSPNGWNQTFWRQIDLDELNANEHERIGTACKRVGDCVGTLTESAQKELGLHVKCKVAVGMIDAHAGAVGMVGMRLPRECGSVPLERRLALICGSSSCLMATNTKEVFVEGIWGPYFDAMLPDLYLNEAGQSATGLLLEHMIKMHFSYKELERKVSETEQNKFDLLNSRLEEMSKARNTPVSRLCADLHVYPDYHGNRSPFNDASLRGMVCGAQMDDTFDGLALLYLATVQSLALCCRLILDRLAECGIRCDVIVACGGDARNRLFVQEHANCCQLPVVLPEQQESVTLGAAMLASTACAHYSLREAMSAMSRAKTLIEPDSDARAFVEKKLRVFIEMHNDQLKYKKIMRESR